MDEAHEQIMSLLRQIKEKVDSIEEELLDLRDDFDEEFGEEEDEEMEMSNPEPLQSSQTYN